LGGAHPLKRGAPLLVAGRNLRERCATFDAKNGPPRVPELAQRRRHGRFGRGARKAPGPAAAPRAVRRRRVAPFDQPGHQPPSCQCADDDDAEFAAGQAPDSVRRATAPAIAAAALVPASGAQLLGLEHLTRIAAGTHPTRAAQSGDHFRQRYALTAAGRQANARDSRHTAGTRSRSGSPRQSGHAKAAGARDVAMRPHRGRGQRDRREDRKTKSAIPVVSSVSGATTAIRAAVRSSGPRAAGTRSERVASSRITSLTPAIGWADHSSRNPIASIGHGAASQGGARQARTDYRTRAGTERRRRTRAAGRRGASHCTRSTSSTTTSASASVASAIIRRRSLRPNNLRNPSQGRGSADCEKFPQPFSNPVFAATATAPPAIRPASPYSAILSPARYSA